MKKASKVVNKLKAIDESLTADKTRVPWIKTAKADTIFGVVILLNAAFIGIDIEFGGEGFNLWLWLVESTFLVIFCVEIVLRLRAEWPHLRKFFDAWGIFDTVITILGCIDAWVVTPILGTGQDNPLSSFTVLRMLRLVRLVRLIRVLRMFGELVVLVQTIGNSLVAVGWMSLLLLMIMYVGSIITVLLIGLPYKGDDPAVNEFFGSLGSALFSHFCVVTLEGWPDIAAAAMTHNRLWAVYFVFMIVLMNFALVNLMVGVIVERIIHVSEEQENELSAFVAESDQFYSTLQTLFNTADLDLSGTVTRKEVRHLLDLPQTHDIMNAFGINLNIPPATLHTIMDLNRDGPTNFDEFFDACMRMCGSKQSIHSIFVQHDICECQQEIQRKLASVEGQLEQIGKVRGSKVRVAAPRLIAGLSTESPSSIAPCYPSSSPEAALAELLDRMDKFGQIQQQIVAEMHAMKDYAKLQGKDEPGRPSSPGLLHKSGVELDNCCSVDSLFSTRKVPAGRPRSATPVNPAVRAAKRRELEAEFRSKRGPTNVLAH